MRGQRWDSKAVGISSAGLTQLETFTVHSGAAAMESRSGSLHIKALQRFKNKPDENRTMQICIVFVCLYVLTLRWTSDKGVTSPSPNDRWDKWV